MSVEFKARLRVLGAALRRELPNYPLSSQAFAIFNVVIDWSLRLGKQRASFENLMDLARLSGIAKSHVSKTLAWLRRKELIQTGRMRRPKKAEGRAALIKGDWQLVILILPDPSGWRIKSRLKDPHRALLIEELLVLNGQAPGDLGLLEKELTEALADVSLDSALVNLGQVSAGSLPAGTGSVIVGGRDDGGNSAREGVRSQEDSVSKSTDRPGADGGGDSGGGAVTQHVPAGVTQHVTGECYATRTDGGVTQRVTAKGSLWNAVLANENGPEMGVTQHVTEGAVTQHVPAAGGKGGSAYKLHKSHSYETDEAYEQGGTGGIVTQLVTPGITQHVTVGKRSPREKIFIERVEQLFAKKEFDEWGGFWRNAFRKYPGVAERALNEVERMKLEGEKFWKSEGACMGDLYYRWGGTHARAGWENRQRERKGA